MRKPKAYPKATPTFKNICLKAPTDPDNVVGVTEKVYCATNPLFIPTTNPSIILPRINGNSDNLISCINIPSMASISI